MNIACDRDRRPAATAVHLSRRLQRSLINVHEESLSSASRGYKLLTEEVLVVVNTMIRVPWVLFNGSAAGKAPRESRSGLYILGEEWYNRLLESV